MKEIKIMKKIVLSLVTILALTIGILPFLTKEPITANAEETESSESTLIREDGWFYDEDYNGLGDSSDLIFRVYRNKYSETYYYKDSSGESILMASSSYEIFRSIEENGVVTQCGLHLLLEKDTFAAGTKFYIRISGNSTSNNTIYYRFLTAEDDIITLKFRTDKGVTSISYNDDAFKITCVYFSVSSSGTRGGAFWAIENTQSLKVLSITSDSMLGTTYGYAVMSSYEEVGNVAPALRTFKDFEDGFLTKANKWVNNAFNVNLTGPVFGTLFIGLIVLLVVRRGRR